MGAKLSVFFVSLWFIFSVLGCAVARTESTTRIALLAPFEGRYREMGYEALYAARLALQESGRTDVELLPIDDGGTPASAVDRARALAQDPQVIGALLLGFSATEPATIDALQAIPLVELGDWRTPTSDIMAVAQQNAPFTCGELCALMQFPKLRPTLAGITVVSSAHLPDEDFKNRYLASADFAPEPRLIAMLTYDALNTLLDRDEVQATEQRFEFDDDGQLKPITS